MTTTATFHTLDIVQNTEHMFHYPEKRKPCVRLQGKPVYIVKLKCTVCINQYNFGNREMCCFKVWALVPKQLSFNTTCRMVLVLFSNPSFYLV